MKTNNIILASASPRRIELLKKWGLKFTVCPSNIEETTNLKRPSSIVKHLALQKAKNVYEKNKNAVIISADTIVVLNGRIVGKPSDKKHSEKIIRELNGSRHKVYTGVTIIYQNKVSVFYDEAAVFMRKLPENEIRALIGKHMDKAGSYAVQDENDDFVKRITGDYNTVVGLPYYKLKKEIKKFGITI